MDYFIRRKAMYSIQFSKSFFRREDTFVSKNYRIDGYNRSVGLISAVNLDGSLLIRYTRNKKEKKK